MIKMIKVINAIECVTKILTGINKKTIVGHLYQMMEANYKSYDLDDKINKFNAPIGNGFLIKI